ncbi:hypothetical protein HMPREF1981_01042 [Bacteroides pyogenes F0041]|uniref:Uncharacterized protein n=1 Tax=Bacteroides pyogenes F0041 TaxID=1321819 RepID=U2E1T8_9BACE|nr:hypothetical protein HMPREF1981_01042 [Bacteroides pyogenes F0041]
MFFGGISGRVETDAVKRNAEFAAKPTDKLLVPVGFCTSQMKVTVSSFAPVAGGMKKMQQSNRVGATAQCHKNFTLR